MTEALRPGDPPVLGPFTLSGRLAEHDAGVVFLGADGSGRRAAVAVLHAAAASDAAVRDRLAGAIETLSAEQPDRVLGSAPRDTVPWVATPYEDGDPADAQALLDNAALTQAVASTTTRAAGPDFAPHWSGAPGAGAVGSLPTALPPAPYSAPRNTTSVRSIVLLAVGIVLCLGVIVGGGVAMYMISDNRKQDDPVAQPTTNPDPDPTTGTGTGTETGGTPPPTPPIPGWPTPEPAWTGPDGPNGPLGGPTFGEGEPTYFMDLKDFSFDFRVPKTWGCMRSGKVVAPTVRWICLDDAWAFGGKPGSAPGGIVQTDPCPAPCGPQEWRAIRERTETPPTPWRSTDASTFFADGQVVDGTEIEWQLMVSHVFASKPGGPLDTHLFLRLTGPMSEKENLQKTANEIRIKTP
ncbi:hypothetical protein [Tenggerimyces flavus]|uniref:Uncharacterized protein n=1 Tax=Tenggerimyces flavus TaxID=1708749 RepID=A0ABV7YDL8_9ACTN|nr:hypothetical protein [Tenggerimyces flavus]MBM7789010.1 hypothetical protein [Tenggerimyces flavus]